MASGISAARSGASGCPPRFPRVAHAGVVGRTVRFRPAPSTDRCPSYSVSTRNYCGCRFFTHYAMRYNTHQVDAATVERVQRNGREYLSFPLVPLREMVLNYPEHGTDEYLPAEKINASAPAWAGTPLTFKHPPNRGDGQTARTPDAYTDEVFGQFHEPDTTDGGSKLRGRGLIDVDKANAIGGAAQQVVDRLNAGETVSVSAGYGTIDDESEQGTFDGENYNLVQGDLIPDHIAVFPSDEFNARCSPEDGCGAPRVNATRDDATTMSQVDDHPDPGTIRRVLNFIGSTDDEHEHDHNGCGCGGECADCSVTTNAADDDGADEGTGDPADEEPTADDEPEEPMSEEDITLDGRAAELHEQTAFTAEQLNEMDEEQLSAIRPDADEGTEEETDEETEADEGTEPADDDRTEPDIQELVQEAVQAELDAAKIDSQVERDAEIVANATDIPREAAETMDPEKLSEMAEEHAGSERQKTNYAAVPGSVDRTNYGEDEPDTEGISAGTFSDYEQRKESGD